MNGCQHTAVIDGEHHGYTAAVNTGGVTEENRAAHGGVHYEQQCYDCKQVRDVNQNGPQFEFGAWLPKPATQALLAASIALKSGDLAGAREQLAIYTAWRSSGGVEPIRGDAKAFELACVLTAQRQ